MTVRLPSDPRKSPDFHEFAHPQRVEAALAGLQLALAESLGQLRDGQRQALLGALQRVIDSLGIQQTINPTAAPFSDSEHKAVEPVELTPQVLVLRLGGEGSQILSPHPGAVALNRGQIVGETREFWVQQVAHRTFVGHEKPKFTKPFAIGAVVEIGYPNNDTPVVRPLGILCAITAEKGGVVPPNPGLLRPEPSLAFECMARAHAVVRCPALADVYAVLDAAESRARLEYRADIKAQRLVVRATRAAMIRALNKGHLPAAQTVNSALAQGMAGRSMDLATD